MSECPHCSKIEIPEGAVEITRITVVKTFDDNADGGAGVFIVYGDSVNLVDALGMLSFAQTVAPVDFGMIPLRED